MNSAFNSQVSFYAISAEGKLLLLDMAYSRLRYGVNAMTFVSAILA